jgi:dihydrofolate synthase / folylpolyglutamate synthase
VSVRGLLGDYPDLYLPLFGEHQAGNLACAIAAVEAFARTPGSGSADADGGQPEAIDGDLVRRATATMSSPGRLEVVRRSPVVIVDASHNPGGMAASMAALSEAFALSDVTAILAVSADKDVTGILGELEPVVDRLVVTTNSSPRSMGVAELTELAADVFGPDRVMSAARLDDAIEIGVALADEADAVSSGEPGSAGVLITGSVVTAGDARVLLARTEGNAGLDPRDRDHLDDVDPGGSA